ncbi:hypothetical protein DL98DRAFT_622693 [Cadophora sp. DSE1049]|nr:hypothetical protein DL98DRAFT_622693 [Cadophora sp. DSE1049]
MTNSNPSTPHSLRPQKSPIFQSSKMDIDIKVQIPITPDLRNLPSTTYENPAASSSTQAVRNPHEIQLEDNDDERPIIRHLMLCDNCGALGHRWMDCLEPCSFCLSSEHHIPICPVLRERQSGGSGGGHEERQYPSYEKVKKYRQVKDEASREN